MKKNNSFVVWLFGKKENILFLWTIFIILAKVIRYTILKVTLVDAGIGHGMVEAINNHSTAFNLFDSSEAKNSIGDSIGNAAFFWEKTNFLHLHSYIEFEIFVTIVWNLLLLPIFLKSKLHFNALETLFIIMSILMLNIFDFTIAKEPIQISFFIVIFFIINSRKSAFVKSFLSLSVILTAIITFRAYYVLIIFFGFVFGILFNLIMKRKFSIGRMLLIFICVAFSYMVLLIILQKISPSTYEEFIRVRTRCDGATTDILLWINSDNLTLFSLDYFLIILRLLFPIELVRFGPKFLLYVFCQLVMSSVYLKAFSGMKNTSFEERFSFFLFSGFIFMSAAFEPDFGSWVRHESALFPLMFMFSGMIQFKSCDTEETT